MSEPYLDGSYAAANPEWHRQDAPFKAAGILRLLTSLSWRVRTVVDVGCGTGDVLRELVDRRPEWTATGYDISPQAIERARPTTGVTLHLGHPTTTADLCLCLDVAEHAVDDVQLLASLRPLAPRHIIRLPLDLSALDVVRPHRLLAARTQLGHLHAYTRATACQRVRQAGFHIVETRLDRVPPSTDTMRERVVDRIRRLAFQVAPEKTVDLIGGWSLLIAAHPEE